MNQLIQMRIRSVVNSEDNERYFALNDLVQKITGTSTPLNYVRRVRQRNVQLSVIWDSIIKQLLFETERGPRMMNAVTVYGLLRVIPFIPSGEAEPYRVLMAESTHARLRAVIDHLILCDSLWESTRKIPSETLSPDEQKAFQRSLFAHLLPALQLNHEEYDMMVGKLLSEDEFLKSLEKKNNFYHIQNN